MASKLKVFVVGTTYTAPTFRVTVERVIRAESDAAAGRQAERLNELLRLGGSAQTVAVEKTLPNLTLADMPRCPHYSPAGCRPGG